MNDLEKTTADKIAQLTLENDRLRDMIRQAYPPEVYRASPAYRDQNDPQFFSKVGDPIQQNDLNLAQHYMQLDVIPRDLKTKQDLMQFLSKASDLAQLTNAISLLAADLEKLGKDSSNMKIQNQHIQDKMVKDQEELIYLMERRLVEKQRAIKAQMVELSVNAKSVLVDKNSAEKYLM